MAFKIKPIGKKTDFFFLKVIIVFSCAIIGLAGCSPTGCSVFDNLTIQGIVSNQTQPLPNIEIIVSNINAYLNPNADDAITYTGQDGSYNLSFEFQTTNPPSEFVSFWVTFIDSNNIYSSINTNIIINVSSSPSGSTNVNETMTSNL